MIEQQTPAGFSELFSQLDLSDYLDIARRRLLWIVLPALASVLIAYFVAAGIPNVYRCETVILVDPQKVPESYVPSTVSGSITDRLSTIQEQVTSPTRLKRLIESMGLYSELRKRASIQDVIAVMQSSINVDVVNSGGRQLSAFKIAFLGHNPVETAQVTNQLAAMFIEENLKAREQESYGTADFLEDELQKTSKQLQEKEEELGNVRRRYVQDLPESQQFHVQALESLRMQMRDAQDRINRAQQQQIYLQSLAATTAPTVDLDMGANASPFQSQLQEIRSKLSALQTRYGPSHPDVRKLQAKLDELKAADEKREDSAPKAPSVAHKDPIHNPVLEAQLEKLNEDIEGQRTLEAKLKNEMDFHAGKLEQVPVFQEKIAGLTRDFDSLQKRYQQLLDKKLSADTASALESRQKGERFVILDPAQPSEKPYAPNRRLIVLAAFALSLFGGTAFAIVLETVQNSVRGERDAEQLLGMRVLADIPEIVNSKQQWIERLKSCAAIAGTVIVASGIGIAIAHLYSRIV